MLKIVLVVVVGSLLSATIASFFFVWLAKIAERRIMRDPLDDSVLKGDLFPVLVETPAGELTLGVNAQNAFTYATMGASAFPLLFERNRLENGYLYYIKRAGQDTFVLVNAVGLVAALTGTIPEGTVVS